MTSGRSALSAKNGPVCEPGCVGWYEVELDAVRTDGGLVHIRPVHEADHDSPLQAFARRRVRSFDLPLRFFSVS